MRSAIAATLLFASFASTERTWSKPSKSIGRGLPVPDVAYFDASKALLACTDVKPLPSTCQGNWRGIKWLLYTKDWTAQLDLPSGVRWLVSCNYDEIYSEDTCSWTTGDEFVISRGEGNSTFVSWGLRRFPGSEMIARFDAAAPLSTSEKSWSSRQSTAFYRKMLEARELRYRWYSWPEDYERGGALNLAGFANAAAFMEALRDEFTTSRVLHKLPAR